MNDDAQGRFKLGSLPEKETLDAMRDRLYASLGGFVRYRRIRWTDIEHTDECIGPDGGLDCDTNTAASLSPGERERYEQIRAAAPDGSRLDVLAHSCECRGCGAGLVRRSVRVRATAGGISFSREYALGKE
jgi:hypothetical protein